MRVLGVLGIAVSIALAIALLFVPARLIPTVSEILVSAAGGLRGISGSVEQASAGMISAAQVLDSAGETVLDIAESVQNTKQLIESTAGVIETVGETTLEETNQALDSAQAAAQAVDQVLRSLSVLGAITGITYDPQRSLDQAIQDVATGLEPLPRGLIEVSDRLYETAEGFDEVSTGLDQTGGDLRQLSAELNDLGDGLGKLSVRLEDQADSLDRLVERVPLIIWLLVGVIEVLLIGVSLAQVTVINAGRQLYLENRE
jgi:uncharacterized phage infection (PIP) family protein YhgE